MAGWRIVSFDRAAGRGTCASAVGALPFDASVALVDDFAIGEEVDVTLRPAGASYEVTRIVPTGFRAPFRAPPTTLAERIAELLPGVQDGGRGCWASRTRPHASASRTTRTAQRARSNSPAA